VTLKGQNAGPQTSGSVNQDCRLTLHTEGVSGKAGATNRNLNTKPEWTISRGASDLFGCRATHARSVMGKQCDRRDSNSREQGMKQAGTTPKTTLHKQDTLSIHPHQYTQARNADQSRTRRLHALRPTSFIVTSAGSSRSASWSRCRRRLVGRLEGLDCPHHLLPGGLCKKWREEIGGKAGRQAGETKVSDKAWSQTLRHDR
jgi:hypothetical protein